MMKGGAVSEKEYISGPGNGPGVKKEAAGERVPRSRSHRPGLTRTLTLRIRGQLYFIISQRKKQNKYGGINYV